MAASAKRAASDGAWCWLCPSSLSPAIHSHRLDSCNYSPHVADRVEPAGRSSDSRITQGASLAAKPPISLSRASATGGE